MKAQVVPDARGLVPAIHALLSGEQGVDGRDIRAFTPAFAGYARPRLRMGGRCILPLAPMPRIR